MITAGRAGAVSLLYRRLFDDAAVFPPGNAPLPAAVLQHAAYADGPYGGLLGPFVCPLDQLSSLDELATVGLDVSVVVARDRVAEVSQCLLSLQRVPQRIKVVALELGGEVDPAWHLPADASQRVYVEIPLDVPDLSGQLSQLRTRGWAAKFRTGGATAEAFPAPEQLAHGIAACLALGVPFKLTAGLHRAVRQSDATTGFAHHGFLNVLLAVSAALSGASVDETATVLDERDDGWLAQAALDIPPGKAAAVRSYFTSFGTCSIDEPIADLRALNLL